MIELKNLKDLEREHFFKSCATNRHFSNFSEYALKSSENQRFSSPKFFPTEKTFLNANIKSNLNGGLPSGCNLPR
jgi:hypothetical protein